VHDALHYRIADVDVAIEAPIDVLGIVTDAYRRFPKSSALMKPQVTVYADTDKDGHVSIAIGEKDYKTVPAASGRAIVGLELSNAIITAVAQHSRFLIVHAAAIEHEGEALCIAGPGHIGKTLLAAHLLSRGWRCLSDEYAFIEPYSGQIVPFPKLLYVRSTSLPYVPRTFRKCLESSPWYGLGDQPGLVFSGVDPACAYSEAIWSAGARLSRLLVLVKRNAAAPTIKDCAAWSIIPDLNSLAWQPPDLLDGLTRMASALRGVQVGKLVAGEPLATANAIENWAAGDRALAYA